MKLGRANSRRQLNGNLSLNLKSQTTQAGHSNRSRLRLNFRAASPTAAVLNNARQSLASVKCGDAPARNPIINSNAQSIRANIQNAKPRQCGAISGAWPISLGMRPKRSGLRPQAVNPGQPRRRESKKQVKTALIPSYPA
jgi:hypothetical protein